LLAVIVTALFTSTVSASDVDELTPFSKNDRVLILAPHPDDETITTGGVIQRALASGARVKVVCFTNGDNNEIAFIFSKKRLSIRSKDMIRMGETRKEETLRAMAELGVDRNDIIFMGYPDFGTMEILTKYWGDVKPFHALFSHSSKVPYPDCLSPGAPYKGESILNDLKNVIVSFSPTKIFVSHPVDANRDHRALYVFTELALWDTEGRIIRPEVLPFITHVTGWPNPRGYHPDLMLEPPQGLTGVSWRSLLLTPEELKAKYAGMSSYKTQILYNRSYIFSFARKNELFGDYPDVFLKKRPGDDMEWQGVNIAEDENAKGMISALEYAASGGDLLIRLNLKRAMDKDFGISVTLLGYNKNKDFAAMPKLRISLGLEGMNIRDKKKLVSIKKQALRIKTSPSQ